MRPLGVRWKLTLWYAGVLAVALTLFSAVVFGMPRHQLFERIDQRLEQELGEVRSEAEVALRHPRTADEYGRVLENLLEETVRLGQMADLLLFPSRQDAGLNPPVRDDVPLDGVLREVVESMRLVAHEKGVALTPAANPTCRVRGHENRLRRVSYNPINNAVKHTGPGGAVTVGSRIDDEGASVTVEDTGVGIPAAHLPHIFDRFHRVDPARTGENGAGLGSAICQSAVRSAGGSITAVSTEGRGSTFTVRLRRGGSEG